MLRTAHAAHATQAQDVGITHGFFRLVACWVPALHAMPLRLTQLETQVVEHSVCRICRELKPRANPPVFEILDPAFAALATQAPPPFLHHLIRHA